MLSINEQTDLIIINAMTKKAYAPTDSFSTGDSYKKSPQQTYLAACSSVLRGDLPRFTEVMKTAAEYHLIPDINKFASIIRPKTEYAYQDKYLPLDTLENIQKSAQDFSNNYKTLPIEARFKVAEKIYNKLPNKENAPIEVLAYANTDSITFNKQASIDIMKRAQYAPEDIKPYFYALAKTAVFCENNKQFMKVAHTLEKLDKLTSIQFPYTLNDLFVKRAEEKQSSAEVLFFNGLPIKKAALTPDFLQRVLGKDLSSRCFDKQGNLNEQVIRTLPKSDKDLIMEYYNGNK